MGNLSRRTWLLTLPLIGAILAYARALRGDFVFDDLTNVLQDPAARDLAASTRALFPSLLSAGRSLATHTFAGLQLGEYWSPGLEGGRGFTSWTFALHHTLGMATPLGYHLVNLGLHLLVVLLVFLFTRELIGRAGAKYPAGCALAVAGIFALHPLHSQAVNYITQRSEVLASAFYLAGLLLLLRAETHKKKVAVLSFSLALLLFVLGLGTKVIIVTMPVAYLLLGLMIPDRRPGAFHPTWIRRLAMTVPFFVLGGVKGLALIKSIEGHADAGFSVAIAGLNPWTYFLTEWKVVLVYVKLLIWPSGQRFDWAYPISTRLDFAGLAAGTVLSAGILGAAFLVWRVRRDHGAGSGATRVASFGTLWFLLLLVPTSSFIPLADPLVEHRMYLASFGLIIGVTVVLGHFLTTRSVRTAALATAGVWLALGITLYRRNAVWESPAALWGNVVEKQPANSRAHKALAGLHQSQGDLRSAIREYGLALKNSSSGNLAEHLDTVNGFAGALADAGSPRDAVTVGRAALALAPNDATVLATLAASELRAGNPEEAERLANTALTKRPNYSQALLTLGEIHLSSGDAAKAARYLAQAIEVAPNEPIRLLEYGQALALLKRNEEACQAWRKVSRSKESRQSDRDRATQFANGLGCREAVSLD